MKAYVTSVGERTTDLCCEQLERYGFDVVLMDKKESWIDKYSMFIKVANEDCVRVDADVIPNDNVKLVGKDIGDAIMVQYKYFDFYKNNVSVGCPVFYKKEALSGIMSSLKKIHPSRPEATAWRLPNIVERTMTSDLIVGMHGFGSDKNTIERAKRNKIARGQIKDYDFDLAYKIAELYEKSSKT